MSQSLSRQDIIGGLAELAKDFVSRGVAADIYIIGGAALVLRYFDRRLTSDVDLRAMDFELIRPSAEAVALRHDWEPDWINTQRPCLCPPWARQSRGKPFMPLRGSHLM